MAALQVIYKRLAQIMENGAKKSRLTRGMTIRMMKRSLINRWKNDMPIPVYTDIINGLFQLLDQLLDNYVYSGYSALAEHMRAPLGLAIILYFCVMGISMSQGWMRLSMATLVHTALKISLIYVFAMSWNQLSYFVVHGIEESANQIGSWMLQASPVHFPYETNTVNDALQSVLTRVTEIGSWTWKQGNVYKWTPFFTATMIWLFGYAGLVLAVTEMLLAKFMLALLFTFAPLFIPMALYKQTQGIFDRWLGIIVGFSFLLMMMPSALVITMNFMDWGIGGTYASRAANISAMSWVPVMFAGVLNFVMVHCVARYSKLMGASIVTMTESPLSHLIGAAMGVSMLRVTGK